MTVSSRALAGGALAALLAACGGGATPDEMQLAADGTEAITSSQQSTYLAGVVFDAVTQNDPVKAAAQVAAPAGALLPTGCATHAKDPTDPHVAHITFKDCTGPFGLVHLDGEEIITFSAGTKGAVHADIIGVNLTANGHPATYSASADITVSGTMREVVWEGSWTRVDAAGLTVAHTSDLNLDVDTLAGCRTANGTAMTTVGAREVDTTISDYKVCRNTDGEEGCPTGTVTHTGRLTGKSVTIMFDSTDTAEVTGPLGHTFAVTMSCPAADTAAGQ